MDERLRESAERVRTQLAPGPIDPAAFRAALLGVAPLERDAWVDAVLALGELPDDGPELPKDCVPYLPCPVDALLRLTELAPVKTTDVFVDIGSGAGRAAALVHLLTGATTIGLEIQPALVSASRALASRLGASRLSFVEGDATRLVGNLSTGTVFFLYCPFSGERLARVLAALEPIARRQPIRVCSVDLPLPPVPWLALETQSEGDLTIHRSRQPVSQPER